MNLPADFRGSSLPVSFRVIDESGEQQYSETLTVPVLDYTAAEAEEVLNQVLADPKASAQQKTLARSVLTPTSKGKDLEDGNNGGNTSGRAGTTPGANVSEGSSTAGVVFAVLVLIAGLVGIVALPAMPGARR